MEFRANMGGVRLTDFHVAPMCTPTRGQLLTGMDALRNGASSVSAGRSFVPRGIPTMAETFAAGGYKTALFGKWHLGDSYPNLPHYRGFHEAVYHLGWGITAVDFQDGVTGLILSRWCIRVKRGTRLEVRYDIPLGELAQRFVSSPPGPGADSYWTRKEI